MMLLFLIVVHEDYSNMKNHLE